MQVTTRAVQMDGLLVLAPLVDMCSHAEAGVAAAGLVANASSGIVLRALRGIAAGEAVMSILQAVYPPSYAFVSVDTA